MLGIPFSLFGIGALYALARSWIVGPAMDLQQWIGGCMVVGTFGTIGFLMVLGVGVIVRVASHENRLKSQFPGQPWLHQQDWAQSRSKDASIRRAVTYLGVAFTANSLTLGVLAMFLLDFNQMNIGANPVSVIVCISGFVSLTVTGGVYALKFVRNAIRFRAVSCELVAAPFQAADAVRCLVHWNGCRPPKELTVALECTATRTGLKKPAYSEANNTYQHDLHQVRYFVELPETVYIEAAAPLPVRFPLPSSGPESGTDDATWRFRLIWQQNGMEQDLSFDLPIFHAPGVPSQELAERFDSAHASNTGSGYADNARVETLGQLVEANSGSFVEGANGQWTLELPRNKMPGVERILGNIMSAGALLAFGGAALALGGWFVLAFLVVFILLFNRGAGKQRLACDGTTVEYQRQGFLRLRSESFACDEPIKISTDQVEKHSERLGHHQVTAELELEGEVVILRNAMTALLAKRICKKLQASCGLLSSD